MEVRQGGLVFRWPDEGRRIYVFDKNFRALEGITITANQGRRLTLDDVHDAIDEHLDGLTRAEPIG